MYLSLIRRGVLPRGLGRALPPLASRGKHDSVDPAYEETLGETGCEKTSADINRVVKTDTPDATRMAFTGVYGKDNNPASFQDDILRQGVKGSGQGSLTKPPSAGDARAMYDMVYVEGDDKDYQKSSADIKRVVTPETPDLSRLVFADSAYGKDPNEPAFAEASRSKAHELKGSGQGSSTKAPSAGDTRAMYDVEYVEGDETDYQKSSADIKRVVTPETPDLSRLVFADSAYGKDPNEPAFAEASRTKAHELKGQGASSSTIPPSAGDARAMYDSELVEGDEQDYARTSEEISRKVTKSPASSRLSFFGEEVLDGAEPESHEEVLEQEAAKKAASERPSKVHSKRSHWESAYSDGDDVKKP